MILPRLQFMWEASEEFQAKLAQSPAASAKRFFIDTIALSSEALGLAASSVGHDRVVVGTDFPFLPITLERMVNNLEAVVGPGTHNHALLLGSSRVT